MRFFVQRQLVLTLLIVISSGLVQFAEASIQLKAQGDTVSLELTGQSDWNYELKRSSEKGQTKVLLTVKASDQDDFDKIKNVKNPFIKSIQVKPEVDGKKQIEFTLSSSKVETFDYLTDYPSKLIVDFYFNEDPVKVAAAAAEAASLATAVSKKTAENKKNKGDRKPADAEYFNIESNDDRAPVNLKLGLFNSNNDGLARFKINLVELQPPPPPYELSEYYHAYPLLERPFHFWTQMKQNLPEYEIQPENTAENKQIRLIKKLFDKKRTFVLRQTVEWFAKKYPNSKYLEMAYAMAADSHMQLWQTEKKDEIFDLAQYYYEKLMTEYPQSALYERTSLARGMYDLDKKNYLAALRKFKTHIENPQYKDNNSHYYAQLGMTYCLAKLNKIAEAAKMTEEIENLTKDSLTQAEAAFRRGDYLMMDEKYVEASTQYEAATKKYPQHEMLFPNAVFNKMEAFFQLQKSMESHAASLEFIIKFPQDDFAPYALTRLGELFDIMGAPQQRAVGAYLETQFRYGDSPRTIVAQLHLMSTRMKVMQDLELKQTLKKMEDLAKKSDLAHINQFKTIMISDGFSRRKEFDKAIDVLVKHFQAYPGKKNSEQISTRIKANIHAYLRDLSANNKHRDVLKVYQKYADTWIRKQENADTFYYLGKAYQSAGAYEEALKKYDLVEQKLANPTPLTRLNTGGPKFEEVYLKQAQAMYEMKNLQKSEQTLDKIKNTEILSPTEQIERVELASKLHENRGDNDTAIRYLSEIVRLWKDKPDLVIDSAIRLAKLWNKTEMPLKGIEILDQMSKEKITKENVRRLHKAKSEIALAARIPDTAINSLTFLINNEKNPNANLAEEKYRLGDLYFQKGEIKKAENVWSSFEGNDDQFWSKLADEKMKSSQWQDEYKKYLKRIPAAVGVE